MAGKKQLPSKPVGPQGPFKPIGPTGPQKPKKGM
jgi:hypothetical protein